MEDETETATDEQTTATNQDWSRAEPFIKRIDSMQSEIDAIMDAAKEECAPLREDIKVIKTEAEDAGFRKRPLNAVIGERRDIRRANARRAKLDEDQRDDYDKIKHALGMLEDLPLGEAALEKAA